MEQLCDIYNVSPLYFFDLNVPAECRISYKRVNNSRLIGLSSTYDNALSPSDLLLDDVYLANIHNDNYIHLVSKKAEIGDSNL